MTLKWDSLKYLETVRSRAAYWWNELTAKFWLVDWRSTGMESNCQFLIGGLKKYSIGRTCAELTPWVLKGSTWCALQLGEQSVVTVLGARGGRSHSFIIFPFLVSQLSVGAFLFGSSTCCVSNPVPQQRNNQKKNGQARVRLSFIFLIVSLFVFCFFLLLFFVFLLYFLFLTTINFGFLAGVSVRASFKILPFGWAWPGHAFVSKSATYSSPLSPTQLNLPIQP